MSPLKIAIQNRRILSDQYGYFPFMTTLSDGQILITYCTGEDEIPKDLEMNAYQSEKPFQNKPASAFLDENRKALNNPALTGDTANWTIRSADGGKTFQDYGMPFCPCICENPDGSVVALSRLAVEKDGSMHAKIYRSFDKAASWNGPEYIPVIGPKLAYDVHNPYIIFHRSIRFAPDGAALISAYARFKGETRDRVVLYRSDDHFQSLYFYSTIVCDPRHESPHGINESALEYTKDGKLVCVSRTNGFLPMVYSISSNDGATWSEYKQTGSEGVDPDTAKTTGGIIAASYGRPGVFVMFSKDGETWQDRRCIYNHPYESFGLSYRERWDREHTCGYTAIRETAPGKFLLVYSAPITPRSEEIFTPLDSLQRTLFRIWGVDICVEEY